MKNLFSLINNKLTSFSRASSLLFFTLFCIHLGGGVSHSLPNSLHLPAILFNPIQKITEIISEILNGLLEGLGGWTNTMLPNEPSPSTSPSTQEPSIKPESNIGSDKGSDKFVTISLLFLVLMLIPYLSDSSINESILPFIMVFKRSIKLPSLSLSEASKDKLIFTFFTLLILSITSINILPISETSDIESTLISVSFLAKIKGIIPSRPSTTDSLSNVSIDKSLDKKYSRLDGNYPNLEPVQEVGSRASTVTNIEYSGSVLDISREYNFCSTCPSVNSSFILDSCDSTTTSMIQSIRNEEVSSINVEHISIVASSGISTDSVAYSSSKPSSYGEVIYETSAKTFGLTTESAPAVETILPAQGHIVSDIDGTATSSQTDSLLSSASVASSTVESENSMAFDPAFLSYREAQRARTLHYLTTPRDTQLSDEGWKEFQSGLSSDQSFINSPNEEHLSFSNSLTTTNLLITLLMMFINIMLFKYIINSKTYKNIISSNLMKQLMKSQVWKYIKNSIVMKVILTTILGLILKIIVFSLFSLILPFISTVFLPFLLNTYDIILTNVSELHVKLWIEPSNYINPIFDNPLTYLYVLLPGIYIFRATIMYLLRNDIIRTSLIIILQLVLLIFIDKNTFDILTPNIIHLDSSDSSPLKPVNLCHKIKNFFSHFFTIKIKTVYAPLPEAGQLEEDDNYDSLVNNGINPYSTTSPVEGATTSTQIHQKSYKQRVENLQWEIEREALLESDRINKYSKNQSMWFETDSDSQSVELEAPASVHDSGSSRSMSSILGRVRSNSIRNKVRNWLNKNNPDQASKDTSNDDSIWFD
jgi:hypothetical protein